MAQREEELAEEWIKENGSEYEEVMREVSLQDSTNSASRRIDIVGVVSDGSPRIVDIYELKEYLGPRAIGQILLYAKFLPEKRDFQIRDKGIIYRKERDDMSRELAEEHDIGLTEFHP